MTLYVAKILLYKNFHADKVVYFRNKLPMRLIEKYKWYFEYLTAIVKISHPRQKVTLTICPQKYLQGREYVERKTKTLLRGKYATLTRCDKESLKDDLFSFKSKEMLDKKQRIQREIQALEAGEFNYYIPVEYINSIKKFKLKLRL